MTLRSVPFELAHLADVDTLTEPPGTGDALLWDAIAQKWQPGTASSQEDALLLTDSGLLLLTDGGRLLLADGADTTGGIDDPDDFAAVYGTDLGYDQEFDRSPTTSPPAGWSWVNQGTATYKEQFGVGSLVVPYNNPVAWRAIVRALPSESTWEAIFKLKFAWAANTSLSGGVLLRDSASGKVVNWGTTSSFNTQRANDMAQTSLTNYRSLAGAGVPHGYWRVRRNSATAWDFEWSPDGVAWLRFDMGRDISAHLTPNQIGFWAQSFVSAYTVGIGCEWFRVR